MNILITGAAGYMGSHVVRHLSKTTGHQLIPIDLVSPSGNPDTPILQVDLSDRSALRGLFETKPVDCVIHFAGLTNPQESIDNPLAFYSGNVANTLNLLQACYEHRVGKFVFASSPALYGHQRCEPLTEDAVQRAINPYSRSKQMCERIMADASAAYPGFNHVILRIFFGVGGDLAIGPSGHAKSSVNVIRIAAQAALGKRDRLVIYGDGFDTPDGSCVRDFIHIDDICTAVSLSSSYLERGGDSQVFNCGSGQGYSIKELASAMKEVSGTDFQTDIQEPRDNEYPALIADISKARSFLRWTPTRRSLESLCQTTLDLEKRIT